MSAASVPAVVSPRAYVGIHDGHNAAVAEARAGRMHHRDTLLTVSGWRFNRIAPAIPRSGCATAMGKTSLN